MLSASNHLETLLAKFPSDVERSSIKMNGLKNRAQSLEKMLVKTQEQSMSALAEHVRTCITASPMREFS